MTKKILWIDSRNSETKAYRQKLTDRGYKVDNVEDCYDALEKLSSNYDSIVLNPYFLTLGTETRKIHPDAPSVIINSRKDFWDNGLWLYKKIRSGENTKTKLFLLPIARLENNPMIREIDNLTSKDENFCGIFSAIDILPEELARTLEERLR